MVDFKQLTKDIRKGDRRRRLAAVKALDYASEHPEAIPPLLDALKDGHFSVRHAAAQALGHAGDNRALDGLTVALNDENFMVRGAAAAALGQLRDPRSCDALAAALSDSDWHVRHHAAAGLSSIGTPAVDALMTLVFAEDEACHRHACEALSEIGDPAAIDVLMEVARHPEANRRVNAIRALGKLKADDAVDLCIDALFDEDPQVVIDAAYALAAIGDPIAIDPMVEVLDNEKVVGRLADFGELALPALLEAIQSPRNTEHLLGIIVALERIKHEDAFYPLVEHLTHEELMVRHAAVNALGWIADPRASLFLEGLLDEDTPVNGRPFFAYVLRALHNIDTPESVAMIDRWYARHSLE